MVQHVHPKLHLTFPHCSRRANDNKKQQQKLAADFRGLNTYVNCLFQLKGVYNFACAIHVFLYSEQAAHFMYCLQWISSLTIVANGLSTCL